MLAFIALDELEPEEQTEIAKHTLEISSQTNLDDIEALTLLHEIGRYMNENPGVKL
jgi:hypothetical protein